ncbi:hypothetical protein I553_2023 [Mycobacterium xenopi 4042]|uniref:Uncharacterized protein n=1 Tax=Mycobacterium xenopi 4042 TaxID=1299334 RepID=X8DN07_MYCXE|nr:hypothetical protein I553_2023 [Mycobacterium xenopi 4042]
MMDWRWVSWPELRAAAELSWPLSPWAAARFCCWRMPTLGAGARAAGTGARV